MQYTIIMAIIGLTIEIIEAICYVVLFQHVRSHNRGMRDILTRQVIQQRRLNHAISFLGQFGLFAFKLFAFLVMLFLQLFRFKIAEPSEMFLYIMMLEFVLFPILNVVTAYALRQMFKICFSV